METESTTLNIRLPRALKIAAERAARESDTSLARIAREAFRQFIKDMKAAKAARKSS